MHYIALVASIDQIKRQIYGGIELAVYVLLLHCTRCTHNGRPHGSYSQLATMNEPEKVEYSETMLAVAPGRDWLGHGNINQRC